MPNRRRLTCRLALVALIAVPAAAFAQSPEPLLARGYLTREQWPDYTALLPAPPADGSAIGAADVAVFRTTRALEGSARWQVAVDDNAISRDAMLRNFACALGADLSERDVPSLARVLARSLTDVIGVVDAAKEHFQRPRPFLTEEGATCIVPSERSAEGGSYPSAHSASGWFHALLFAELDPAHAGAILARGRAYGESRVVCGMHYVSDIEAGRTVATAVMAALHGNSEFGADLHMARVELERARDSAAAALAPATCAREAANLKTPW